MENLELRMYGLVPYNISEIQKGIQFGHAKDEYSIQHNTEEYNNWVRNWKTYIILNGGTTNDNESRLGSLNKHAITLSEMNIPISCFYEPDLGDQLTAVDFIVDERVFNLKKYPDFDIIIDGIGKNTNGHGYRSFIDPINPTFESNETKKSWEKWVESIGGYRNLKLREFLKGFELA